MLPEIAGYFESQGCGTLGVDMFMGRLPDEPVACAGLFEAPGAAPEMDFSGVAFERARLLIFVRDADYPAARERIEKFYRSCLSLRHLVLSSAVYMAATPSSAPTMAEWDEHRRPVLKVDVTLWKQLSPLPD